MATKRAAPQVNKDGAAKKAKKVVDPVEQKLTTITGALRMEEAGLPAAVQEILAEILPFTLAVDRDTRHPFQAKMVDMMEGIMKETADNLEKVLQDKKTAVTEVEDEKKTRQENASQALQKLEGAKAESLRERSSLAKVALTWRAAQAALVKAQEEEAAALKAVTTAEKDQKSLTEALQLLGELQEAPDDKKNGLFMKALKSFGFEESMLVALPAALSKQPTERGAFDNLSLESVSTDLKKRIQEKDDCIASAEPTRAAHAAAVAKAEQEFKMKVQDQVDHAKKYTATDDTVKEVNNELQKCESLIKEINNRDKREKRALTNAQVGVELFQEGALKHFAELLELSTAPPPAAVEGTEAATEATEAVQA